MIVSEKIRLYPTKEQEELFFKFSNTARFVYNECLAYKKFMYTENNVSCRIQDLIEHIQDLKYLDDFSWIQETPEAVTKQSIKDLDKAYTNFFKRGNKGFPKFKRKGKCTYSFYQRTDKFRQVDSTHIKITGIKDYVRIRSHTQIGKVVNPRVSYDGKYWYLSYSGECQEAELKTEGEIVGVDLGIKYLAVTSNGEYFKNINYSKRMRQLLKRQKQLQRRVSRKYQLNKQGNQFIKTKNILKLERQLMLLSRRIKNIRKTYLHEVTASIVRSKPYKVVIEDLNVSQMLKNKYLSSKITQMGWSQFRQYLTYKCLYYGINLVVADRWFTSSKLCSDCGNIKKVLSLTERTYTCSECGISMDRDLNAAYNLRNYALSH